MNRKKFNYLIFGIAFLSLSLFLYFSFVFEDEFSTPKLPTKSKAGNITVTSNGCCLWAENVIVSLIDKSGNIINLSQTEKVYENDIFKYNIPDIYKFDFSVLLQLSVFYPDDCKFSEKVLRFNNINDLKKNGLLVYIQEADGAYINAISGKYHVSYKLSNTKPYVWSMQNKPHKVYSMD